MRLFSLTVSLLIACMATLLVACGGQAGSETDAGLPPALASATVNGVTFELVAPSGLPDGLDASDITIASFETSDGDTQVEGDLIAALELGPDGAEFDEPLLLTFVAPAPHRHFAVTHVAADGSVEDLTAVPQRVEPDGVSVTFGVEVSHFSRIFISTLDPTLTILLPDGPPPETTAVGGSVNLRLVVELSTSPLRLRRTGSTVVTAEPLRDEVWTLQYAFRSDGPEELEQFGLDLLFTAEQEQARRPSPLDPVRVPANGSAEASVPAGTSTHTITQSFMCQRPGAYVLYFFVRANQVIDRVETPSGGESRRARSTLLHREFIRIAGECVDAAQTPTSTPVTFTDPGTPTATAITNGPADPTVVLPTAPASPSPYVIGEWHEAPLILVYAHDGAWYDAHNLSVVAAHEPFCTYEHLHGGDIPILVPVDGKPATLSEMYGECGYGPSSALFWIEDPRPH